MLNTQMAPWVFSLRPASSRSARVWTLWSPYELGRRRWYDIQYHIDDRRSQHGHHR